MNSQQGFKIREEMLKLEGDRQLVCDELDKLESKKKELESTIQKISSDIYKNKIYFLHIEEIYRLAQIQFGRLRNKHGSVLTKEDVAELEKWIGRVKTEDGYRSIIDAFREVEKYFASDIKSNLYALVQKIINDGAYKKNKKE